MWNFVVDKASYITKLDDTICLPLKFAYPWNLLETFSYQKLGVSIHWYDKVFFVWSAPAHENTERNPPFSFLTFGVFFHKVSVKVIILPCSCLRVFTVLTKFYNRTWESKFDISCIERTRNYCTIIYWRTWFLFISRKV